MYRPHSQDNLLKIYSVQFSLARTEFFKKISFFAKNRHLFILRAKNNLKNRKYSPFDEESRAFFKNFLASTVRELLEKNRF